MAWCLSKATISPLQAGHNLKIEFSSFTQVLELSPKKIKGEKNFVRILSFLFMWIKLFNGAVSTAEDLNRLRWKDDQ